MTHPEQLGPFHIDHLIGRGGMGAVYKAEYEGIATPLAIKVLLDPMEEDSELRSRFEAEIETLRRLRHPNIVRLFGFGQDEGLLYYAMEFVNGPSLQELLRRKHYFTWEETVHIGTQVAQALRHAHDRGIIHRDIKPANILLPASGDVKVSDYGIAHLFGGVRLTDVNMVIGTIEYMSPEQASAGPITPKTDLYSLGALLYVLLTGVPPYGTGTKSLPELLKKYRQGPPESVRYKRSDIPSELDALLMDLLQVAVDKRPSNAQLVQRRLETILGDYAKTGGLARYFEKNDNEDSTTPNGSNMSAVTILSDEIEGKTDHPTIPIGVTPRGDSEKTKERTKEPSGFVREKSPNATADFVLNDQTGASSFYGDLSDLGETVCAEMDRTITTRILSGNEAFKAPSSDQATLTGDGILKSESVDPVATAGLSIEEKESLEKKTSHFVRVSEEEFDPFQKEEEKSPYVSIQVLAFSMILLSIGVFFWYALKRPSVDSLYNKIEKRIDKTTSESGYLSALRLLDDKFKEFLSYYPNDPRAEKIRGYAEELDLANLERRLEQQIERGRSRASLSVVEDAYIEAIRTLENDPEEGRKKLVAFIDIFSFGSVRLEDASEGEENDSVDQTLPGECVILAQRRLEQVEKDYEQKKRLETELLESHFKLADSFDSTDPIRANQIRQGLIDFYHDRAWAAPMIQKAEEKINATKSAISSGME